MRLAEELAREAEHVADAPPLPRTVGCGTSFQGRPT